MTDTDTQDHVEITPERQAEILKILFKGIVKAHAEELRDDGSWPTRAELAANLKEKSAPPEKLREAGLTEAEMAAVCLSFFDELTAEREGFSESGAALFGALAASNRPEDPLRAHMT